METDDPTDLQLSDGANVWVVHDHITRSEFTQNTMQPVWISREAGVRGERVKLTDSLCGALKSMEYNDRL